MREENLKKSIDGLCVGCKTPQKIAFQDVWYLNTHYKVGDCPSCKYEHSIFVERSC